jgi:hypothetical protein
MLPRVFENTPEELEFLKRKLAKVIQDIRYYEGMRADLEQEIAYCEEVIEHGELLNEDD